MTPRRIRIIAVERVRSTTVDREVAELPRVGDGIGVNGRDVVVRSVIKAVPSTGIDALVYATLPLESLREARGTAELADLGDELWVGVGSQESVPTMGAPGIEPGTSRV